MSLSHDFSDLPASLSHLQAAGVAFDALTSEPRLLSLDCTGLEQRHGGDLGLPDGQAVLSELRAWMLSHAGNHAAVNAIWRELTGRARRPDQDWKIAALGMAMPRLVKQAGALARDYHGDPHDIDAAMVEGFLQALRGLDLAEDGLHVKLCWAAYRAGREVRYADTDVEYRDDLDNEGAAPHRPYGHVDLLFARGVALGLIDADEAELIIDTRLEYLPIAERAELTGERVSTLCRRRERAGLRLAGGLADGHLSGPVSEPVRRELARQAARRRAARQHTAETGTAA